MHHAWQSSVFEGKLASVNTGKNPWDRYHGGASHIVRLFHFTLVFLVGPIRCSGKSQYAGHVGKDPVDRKSEGETCPELVVHDAPTYTNPFDFFHPRKSGGTSLRKVIFAAAKTKVVNHSIIIPCDTGPCTIVTPS